MSEVKVPDGIEALATVTSENIRPELCADALMHASYQTISQELLRCAGQQDMADERNVGVTRIRFVSQGIDATTRPAASTR